MNPPFLIVFLKKQFGIKGHIQNNIFKIILMINNSNDTLKKYPI